MNPKIKDIAQHMIGMCGTAMGFAEQHDVDQDELENELISQCIEQCNDCGCWTAEGDYDFPNGHDAVCYQCIGEEQ